MFGEPRTAQGSCSNESKGGEGGGRMLARTRQWVALESSGDRGLAGVAGGKETHQRLLQGSAQGLDLSWGHGSGAREERTGP